MCLPCDLQPQATATHNKLGALHVPIRGSSRQQAAIVRCG